VGKPVEIIADAPSGGKSSNNGGVARHASTIISIGAALDERTQLRPLIIAAPEELNLTPGTFVTVRVTGDENADVFTLPAAAMATRTSVWRVGGNKLEEVAVDIIDITEETVIVRSFDVKDGIVISQVPTSFVARPVKIRGTRDEAAQ
jgi:hypothetical protein